MKTYSGDYLQEIVFPLAGIGTGGVGLSGTGALVDWELRGKPNKWSLNEFTHFAIKAEQEGKVVDARVLMGDATRSLSGNPYYAHHHSWGYGNGINRSTLAGMPHFSDVTFHGGFPFASIDYEGEKMPARVRLTAFNPFIPGNEDDSSIPAAFFTWEIANTGDKETTYTLAFSVGNTFKTSEGARNSFLQGGGLSAMRLSSKNWTPEEKEYGELVIATDCEDVSWQEYWYRSGWFDELTVFWREFSAPGKLNNRSYDDDELRGKLDVGDMATLAARVTLKPGQSGKIRFVMSWYYPWFEKYWDKNKPVWKHEYCRRFDSAEAVARYCFKDYAPLQTRSRRFEDALLGVTMPEDCVEAALYNLEVFKSPTCLRLENGDFWAFEGTNATEGSCEGTCDHVWGYQYALAYLFPRMARRILEIDYDYNMKPSGEMMFRTMLPLGSEKWPFRACVDGQMGCVIRFYREWKLSGDDAWLKKYWEKIKKSLEYAWSSENKDLWDPGKTGVITGRQHHTLDVELFGPCSWLTGYYLAALKAASEMAAYLGEKDKAEEYRAIFEKGSRYVDEQLFNGRHYIQKVNVADKGELAPYAQSDPNIYYYWNDEKKELKYQFAEGSEIDQLVGQWHATLMGLGDLLDPAHRKQAARAIYDINFKSMRDLANPCRVFACNDERGAVICEWEEGKYRPQIPIPYTEECMTGFEYAAAQLMMQEGLVDEGEELVRAIRARYDGKKRNPFAEIECGSSYARSMASFSLPAVYAGCHCDMVKKRVSFDPIIKDDMRSVWFISGAWGVYEKTGDETRLRVLSGKLPLKELALPYLKAVSQLTCDGAGIPFCFDAREGIVYADCTVTEELTLR